MHISKDMNLRLVCTVSPSTVSIIIAVYFLPYTQDRQCTCNVTLRRVHVTIVNVEKQ